MVPTMCLRECQRAVDTLCLVVLPSDSLLKGGICHYRMNDNYFDFIWIGRIILFDINGDFAEVVYTGGSQYFENCDLWCINQLKYPDFISQMADKKKCNITSLMVKFDMIRFHSPEKIPTDMKAYSNHANEISNWYFGLFV